MTGLKVGDKVRRVGLDNVNDGARVGTIGTVAWVDGDGYIGVYYPGCFGWGDGSEIWHPRFAELVQEPQHEFNEKDDEEPVKKNTTTFLEAVRAQAAAWFAEYDKHNHFPEMLALDAYAAGHAAAQQPAACPKCGGTGEADSGGIMPWGAPAMILCECQQPAAVGAKDAEIETLKVEVAAQRTRADAMAGEAIKHEARAEWLAEALRLIESAKDRGFGIDYARGLAQSALLREAKP